MDILDIMKARYSVRQYSGRKIEDDKREALAALTDQCNRGYAGLGRCRVRPVYV